MFGLFKKQHAAAPLPAVLDPEVPRNEKAYFKRVMDESKSVLDAPLEDFDVLCKQPGWSVHRKPVAGTKVAGLSDAVYCDRCSLCCSCCAACTVSLGARLVLTIPWHTSARKIQIGQVQDSSQ
jgi:hypothetical protein